MVNNLFLVFMECLSLTNWVLLWIELGRFKWWLLVNKISMFYLSYRLMTNQEHCAWLLCSVHSAASQLHLMMHFPRPQNSSSPDSQLMLSINTQLSLIFSKSLCKACCSCCPANSLGSCLGLSEWRVRRWVRPNVLSGAERLRGSWGWNTVYRVFLYSLSDVSEQTTYLLGLSSEECTPRRKVWKVRNFCCSFSVEMSVASQSFNSVH
jgi:hypothetical protein